MLQDRQSRRKSERKASASQRDERKGESGGCSVDLYISFDQHQRRAILPPPIRFIYSTRDNYIVRMSSVLSSFNRSRPTSPIKPPSPLKPPSKTSHSTSQHPRHSSGVYSTFSTKQIQGFKEAFNMLDEDSNGLVSREDLKATLRNLGGEDSEAVVKRYFDSAVGGQNAAGINFTQFLTMFGEHLNEVSKTVPWDMASVKAASPSRAECSDLSPADGRSAHATRSIRVLRREGRRGDRRSRAQALALECGRSYDRRRGACDALCKAFGGRSQCETYPGMLIIHTSLRPSPSPPDKPSQIDRLLSGPFTDRGGKNFDYRACAYHPHPHPRLRRRRPLLNFRTTS